jgi:hypothetical protein
VESQLLNAGEVLGDYLVGREMELQDLVLELATYKGAAGAPGEPSQPANPGLERGCRPLSASNEAPDKNPITRWWQSPLIVRHVNRTICGKPAPGTDGGDIELLRELGGGAQYPRAISTKCGGVAYHELRLLQANVVGHLDIYEPESSRATSFLESARDRGLADRVNVLTSDPFASGHTNIYDLVYWKDNLHLIEEIEAWTRWSFGLLQDQGMFFMNGFLRCRNTYTPRQIRIANQVRATLPERYLGGRGIGPRPPSQLHFAAEAGGAPVPPTIAEVIADRFPNLTIIPTGGVVYGLALSDILANFDDECGNALLQTLLLADDLCIEAGESPYAVAHARKIKGSGAES